MEEDVFLPGMNRIRSALQFKDNILVAASNAPCNKSAHTACNA